MTSFEEMRNYIRDWMSQPLTSVDLAKTYAELRTELDRQLEINMKSFTQEEE